MLSRRETKILATLGTACATPDMMRTLIREGWVRSEAERGRKAEARKSEPRGKKSEVSGQRSEGIWHKSELRTIGQFACRFDC